MKRITRLFSIFIIVSLSIAFTGASCSKGEDNGGKGGTDTTVVESGSSLSGLTLYLINGGKSSCQIVYNYASYNDRVNAQALQKAIKTCSGITLNLVSSTQAKTDFEILIGKTGRDESTAAMAEISDKGYNVCVTGKKLVIVGSTDENLAMGLYFLQDNILKKSACTGAGYLKVSTSFKHSDSSDTSIPMGKMISLGYAFTNKLTLIGKCPADGGIVVGQGAASDGTNVYFLNRTSGDTGAAIFKYTLKDFKFVARSEQFYAGHANDMTYDSKNNRLVVVHGNTEGKILTMVDASSLAVTGNINITVGSGALAYNTKSNQYAISQGGKTLYVADENFSVLKSYTRSDNSSYTAQGMGCDEYCIYFPMSGSADNILSVYDWSGRYIMNVVLDTTTESESMFCVNDTYYVSFYAGSSKGALLYRLDTTLVYSWTR